MFLADLSASVNHQQHTSLQLPPENKAFAPPSTIQVTSTEKTFGDVSFFPFEFSCAVFWEGVKVE